MAQTNPPIGSSPLAAMQAKLGANMPPGGVPPQMMQQGQVWRGPDPRMGAPGALGYGSPGSSTGVAQTPNNMQLADQLRAQMGAQGKPMPQWPGAGGQAPGTANLMQTIQQIPRQGGAGGALNTLRPPPGAPAQGAGGGKAPGQPGQQMKQQIGQLPGAPPPGAPGRGAAGKGPGTPQQQQMKQQIAGLPR